MFITTPLTNEEKLIFDFDKNNINRFIHKLDNDTFYLGGKIKMKHNDIINLNSIEQVRVIDKINYEKFGGPCNSFEAASIYQHNKDIEFIENMIKSYNKIIEMRTG